MSAVKSSYKGVDFEIIDLNKLFTPGFTPGFYYTAGEGEPAVARDDILETTVLEGPYATLDAAHEAAKTFIDGCLVPA